MFEFTTQTIFNHIEKKNSTEVTKNTNVIVYENDTEETGPKLRIGNLRFDPENIESIEVHHYSDEHLAEVSFDLSKVFAGSTVTEDEAGNYRVALYIGLPMNSQDSYYSNDLTYKGRPLYVEFLAKKGESLETVAKRVVTNAKKYFSFIIEKPIATVTAEGSTVTFKGTDGYQQFKKAVLQKYDPVAVQIDCCTNDGDFIDIITGIPVAYKFEDGEFTSLNKKLNDLGELEDLDLNVETPILPGIEAFLDYNWIIRNLRLPTMAQTYFWSPTASEMPIIGGKYDQYIIRMCKERDGIAGEVVGQRAISVTTHVLYVLQGAETSDVIMSTLQELVGQDAIKHRADDVLQDPYNQGSETTEP